MRRFAVSSWSLDGLLQSGLPLLDLPAQLAEHGITTLEVCHFHLPTTEPAYVQALRQALEAAGVELYSVLIDTGDIAAPDDEQRTADIRLIEGWIATAAALGAERVRIDAGQQPPTPEVVRRSGQQLRAFAEYAASQGLRVSTENWRKTSQQPDALLAILDQCAGQVGLCADTGNAEATADKYATLARLLPQATSIHFKARYAQDGMIDADDLQRCLDLIRETSFDGVITLIFDRKRDEWAGVERLRQALLPLM
jgi:sugar phosphate isomerase/epimerase